MPAMQKIHGVVQMGAKRGRALGYPTINLSLEKSTVSGIYAALAYVDGGAPYLAAVFADPTRGIIEAHLLDFRGEIYGLDATIELHEKIRDTKRFSSDVELKTAIADDIAKVREYFKD